MRLSFIRPISCCAVSSSPTTSVKPQTPLFLKPPNYKTTLTDLKKWHLWAKTLASSVGSTFLKLDNGPHSDLLLRELNWLIEDAIETPKLLLQESHNTVSLRVCLDELYDLWKQRVEKRRPFQYVVGCEHWRDLVLSVEEGVLIPRPETELIVDLVNDVVKDNEGLREGLWADLGTGSGALAIGIGRILGCEGRVIATDLSHVATAVASYNVQRYDLEGRRKKAFSASCWLSEEGVLIPRPETELLVDLVDDVIKDNEGLRERLWTDLGTGSGALAIGIARISGTNGRVIATDLSPIAAAVASYNAQRDLVLSVEEGVLIPRHETKLIVDLVDDVVNDNEELREGLWADLGTGSGALAIGIGRILGSEGRVVATDLSHVATAVASYNVQRYDLEGKVHVKQGSWFEPLRDNEGEFVGLVSNPPYIPSKDIGGLQAEVGRHEPRLALDGGASGMNDLIHLCDGAVSMLKPGGFFAFETNGDEQSKFLVDYIETKKQGSFSKVKMVSDFAGIKRFITGFRGR